MKSFNALFKEESIWGEQEVVRFRWILIALIMLFIGHIFISGDTERGFISLALASFYIFYNSIINFLLKKFGNAVWIRYASSTIDITVLSIHIFNYSFFFQPIAVVSAASTFLYPALILLSVLRYDGKLVIFSTLYAILCYNIIFSLRLNEIPLDLQQNIPSANWTGQFYKSAYFIIMGYFLFSIPKMINRLVYKQSIILTDRKEVELDLALEKQKKELVFDQLKKEKSLNNKLSEHQKTIEKQKTDLEHAISVKDKLFSIIGHDLKSPFTAQISMIKLILSDIDTYSKEDFKNALTGILHSSNQGVDLLENILEWSKHQNLTNNLNLTPVRLKAIVDETLLLLKQNIELKKLATLNLVTPEVIVYGDSNMIKTIIRNIISNSIKYNHKNGLIEISTKKEGQAQLLSIRDEGVGMNPEQIAKLFNNDQFISTPGTLNEPGTGLGLFLCKELATKNNADIKVNSMPNKGSTFTLVFNSTTANKKENLKKEDSVIAM